MPLQTCDPWRPRYILRYFTAACAWTTSVILGQVMARKRCNRLLDVDIVYMRRLYLPSLPIVTILITEMLESASVAEES
ncbi:hypothetical protein BDN70DRAFT_481621 [Pholiota conissans]|uniref:Uncharacterized protein n=1 Tax=Pholiota conissans TaxID=109636 RepID=A0A9P5Z8T8_9AGAR|nr:hypothetical protein BDN70DRAFT_481621 [Pholiota conissans]